MRIQASKMNERKKPARVVSKSIRVPGRKRVLARQLIAETIKIE
jgi:hypothetical protein